ncbi:MAG: contractile injection system tape measure protein, partial [Algibacter sp.]
CDRYGRDEKKRHQIDKLTVDLGHVQMETITAVFTEKLNEALASVQDSGYIKEVVEETPEIPQKTPLKVVSYYLKSGRLPWWSSKTSKSYLQDQLDQLIKTPDATFTKILEQLPFNHVYLDRFLYTFTEEQILLCLQVLTNISVKELPAVRKELVHRIQKQADKKTSAYTDAKIGRTFWKVAFNQVLKAINYKNLIASCEQQIMQELGIDVKKSKKENQNSYLPAIRSLVEKQKKQYPGDTIWQHFFEHLIGVVNHPSFYQIPVQILKELKQLLEGLRIAHDKAKGVTETKEQSIEGQRIAQDKAKGVTETKEQSIEGQRIAHDKAKGVTETKEQSIEGQRIAQDKAKAITETKEQPVEGQRIAQDKVKRVTETKQQPTEGQRIAQDKAKAITETKEQPVEGQCIEHDKAKGVTETKEQSIEGQCIEHDKAKTITETKEQPVEGQRIEHDKAKTITETKEQSVEGQRIAQDKAKAVTEMKLQPIARHLQLLQAMLKPLQPDGKLAVIETLPSQFEDTDFITIQNAGLVLLWPFLQRFFENLEVMAGKAFHDEIARNKAVCALQYLCDTTETELFEGMLPFAKVLCGVPLEDTISPICLSVAEKDMAEGLLRSVIERGPHWTNLSLDGFRASYLCRQGSLRTRDGHWLLQVQKETYDITLEKLPWSINTIKLPWMNEILIVEWN